MAHLLDEQTAGIKIARITAVKSAVPDSSKNKVAGMSIKPMASEEEKRRNSKTDANRDWIVGRTLSGKDFPSGFLGSDTEWLMWLDDDTVPPRGFLSHLMNLGREFVAGLYFLPTPPHNPVAYMRRPDGFYNAVYNYPKGALLQVDSVGMGCTLIHRSVFEKIVDSYDVFCRPDGSVFPVLKSAVKDDKEAREGLRTYVKGGYAHVPVTRPKEDDNRPWPFYLLEYGRTEDHWFCELANAVGFRPWLDTNLVCDHYKAQPTGYREYLESLNDENANT